MKAVRGDASEPGVPRASRRIRGLLVAALASWTVFGMILLLWVERPAAGPGDSVAHATLFAGLTATALGLLKAWNAQRVAFAAAIALLVLAAPSSEVLQWAVTDRRSASMSDVWADLVGLLIGGTLFAVVSICFVRSAAAILGIGSLVAVVVVSGLTAGGLIQESVWWKCRDHRGVPVQDSVLDVSPGPILELVGPEDPRGSDGRSDRDREAARDASAAWCESMRNGGITFVSVFDVGSSGDSVTVVFSSSAEGSEDDANVELLARGRDLSVGFRPAAGFEVTRIAVPGALPDLTRQLVAVRLSGESLTVFAGERRVLAVQVFVALDDMQVDAPVDAGGDTRYLGVFGRPLTDDEITSALGSLMGQP